MVVRISPFSPEGEVRAISSKSDAHRKLILASLCQTPTRVYARGCGEDVEATCRCLRALGARIDAFSGGYAVFPGRKDALPHLDAGESGSTLRFLLPVAAALYPAFSCAGRGRLPARPVRELLSALSQNGVNFSSDALPLTARGRLRPGRFALPGNVSSQYVTGVLLALPLLDGDSEIQIEGRLESRAYVDITRQAMAAFGVVSLETPGGYLVPGRQTPVSPGETEAEGDWSNAAFFLAAGALSPNGVRVQGLSADSPQGDRAILAGLRALGADARMEGGAALTSSAALRGAEIDLTDAPDLIAPLAAAAAFARGETRFTGIARLRFKESDRICAIQALLRALGGRAEAQGDALTVWGGDLAGGQASGAGDHRIVMAAAIAAARCSGNVEIDGAEAVNKSYPGFFEDLSRIGGRAYGV